MGDLVTTTYTTLRRANWWNVLGVSILCLWAAPVIHTPTGDEIALVELGSDVPVPGWPGWALPLATATCLLAFTTARSPSRIPPRLILLTAPTAIAALLVTVITAVTQLHATTGYATYFLTAALVINAVVAVPASRKDIPMPRELRSEERWDYDGTNGTDAQPDTGTRHRRDQPGRRSDRGPRVL